MFLSQLVVNLRSPAVRRDLALPYQMHKTVWSAFPDGDPGRVLFRVEPVRSGPPMVLVQSTREPDWSALPVGYLARPAAAKLFAPRFAAGQRLRFRLRANPTKRIAAKNTRHGTTLAGKRVGLLTEREQIAWLVRKGEQGGFSIPGGWIAAVDPETSEPIRLPNFRVDVIPEGHVENSKGGRLVAVRFEGVLTVADSVAFVDLVAAGVGSGKGFGFGLLSVAGV